MLQLRGETVGDTAGSHPQTVVLQLLDHMLCVPKFSSKTLKASLFSKTIP